MCRRTLEKTISATPRPAAAAASRRRRGAAVAAAASADITSTRPAPFALATSALSAASKGLPLRYTAGARPYVSGCYGAGRRDAASRGGRRHSPSAAAPHPHCRHVVLWRHEPSPRACSLSDGIMESGADLDSQLIARDVTLRENTSFEVPLTSHVTPVTLLPQPTQFFVGWKLNSAPMEKKAAI
ncbi:uncharacterized protein LOC126474624 [Schistocerca serialis cubense]|uniref:uncharacterized protein LOC126474624 n=1 Tax=Schistocerca serialis cubense TaxID=2023355 RepID=UPI00214E1FC1|nr:uncharacterized protein LOC126474624 [Schistocerca serialis cubense]